MSHDSLSTVRTDADNLNRCLKFLLEEGNIVVELFGELVLARELSHISLPAGQFLVNGFNTLLDVVGEVACLDTIDLVSRASLDGGEIVEHVALHHDELRNPVDHNRIAKGYKVNPTAATFTTRYSAILMTQVANLLARLVEQLGGERTCANTRAVSLHDAKHLANLVRTNAQTRAGTSTNGVGRGHERIAAKVNIEHRTLSTFTENALARAQHLINLVLAVNQVELTQILNTFQPLLLYFVDVVFKVQRFQNSLMASLVGSILLLEVVEDIAHAQTITETLSVYVGPMPLPVVPTLFLPFWAS